MPTFCGLRISVPSFLRRRTLRKSTQPCTSEEKYYVQRQTDILKAKLPSEEIIRLLAKLEEQRVAAWREMKAERC